MATAADVMNAPIAIDADSPVSAAAREMSEHHVGMLPVVRDGGVVGVVTDRDLVLRVLAAGLDAEATRVEDVATTWVVEVAPQMRIDEVEAVIEEHRVRRLPVVSGGRLLGVVSQSDLARLSPGASPHLLEAPPVWLE
jgi:CBS domain-containing protein